MPDTLHRDRHPGAQAGFWDELARSRDELGRTIAPPAANVGVVGPLGVALPTVRRLQRQLGAAGCEVVVLSPRAELVCEPAWTLVRNGARLAEAAHRPEPSVLVIDVPVSLPVWVGPLVERLRRAGMDLVHLVVDDDPGDDRLVAAAQALGRPLALDVSSPLAPGRLVGLVEAGWPLASVRGVPLTAELILAAHRAAVPARRGGQGGVWGLERGAAGATAG